MLATVLPNGTSLTRTSTIIIKEAFEHACDETQEYQKGKQCVPRIENQVGGSNVVAPKEVMAPEEPRNLVSGVDIGILGT